MAAAAAAVDSVKRIKAEATCSICLELLRDPVTTACGHSFCQPCITLHHKGNEDFTCPQCRRWLQKGTLRPNQDLKKIVALFSLQAEEKPAGGNTCETHQEPLKLYCKEHQRPICLVCRESQAHRGHSVVPVQEAVQEYRGKMAEQLGIIESCFGKLHQFVSEIWKHLPQNEQDEERQNLARVSEKLRVLQEHTESPGKRSEDPASQTKESPSESDSSGKEVSERTELRGHSGREPGSEPAAETRGETGSHAGPVGKEAPTPKYVLSQGSLEEAIHNISITRGDAEPKVDVKEPKKRAEDRPSPTPAVGSGGSGTDATTESRKQEGEGAPAGDWEQPPPLDPPPPPLPQPPCLSPDTASASTPANAPTPATTPREGAAMGSRKEAAGAGQQHPGSKKSKNRKGRNKKSR